MPGSGDTQGGHQRMSWPAMNNKKIEMPIANVINFRVIDAIYSHNHIIRGH